MLAKRLEIAFTRHARLALDKRGIKKAWVKRAINDPDRVLSGHAGDRSEVRKRMIDEAGEQTLSVVIAPTRRKALVVTAYFDAPRPGAATPASPDLMVEDVAR